MSKRKKSGFVGGKGYYIALILGAVAIGVSGYMYYANDKDTDVSNEDPAALVGALQQEGTQPSATAATNPAEENAQQQTVPVKPEKRLAPVSGDLLTEYAEDTLCYNPTTRDWRTHRGIDIAAEAGTDVCAAADGTVYTVYEDETMGMTVVIRHEGGYTTTYSSLAEDVLVKAGDPVSAGQTIGKVGNTALLENAIGDHLHFAVSCAEEFVDPAEFLAN